MTVGHLAREFKLSRTALLYYDRIGLLRPTGRSTGNYRVYRQPEVERLRQICFYRRMGIPLREIARLLQRDRATGPSETVLRRRLQTLETEIESLQEQQRQIVRLLEHFPGRPAPAPRNAAGGFARPPRIPSASSRGSNAFQENIMVTKDKWVQIMKAAGFSEQNMLDWHRTFEKLEPTGHQEFLESLGIAKEEIRAIRERSAR